MTGLVIEDDFAGPGGWEVGARLIGLTAPITGNEINTNACATAVAAGFTRVQCDVRALVRSGPRWGLISSAPCPAFSQAGKRGGIKDIPRLLAHIDRCRLAELWVDYDRAGWVDPTSNLALEVVRAIFDLTPTWLALEQVAAARPAYERIAQLLRARGYRVWLDVLSTEQYGVPQTRERLILTASLDPAHNVSKPSATHRRYGSPIQDGLFDDGLLPPVTMAEALGWGLPDRPAWTVTGGGTKQGGAEVFGNAGNRRELARYPRVQTNNDSRQARGTKERYTRSTDAPSPTVTSGTRSWRLLAAGATSPQTAGTRPRGLDEPAATITGKGTAAWVADRPATTVQGDPRIAAPGHRDRAGGERQFGADSVRVSVAEAACLQSFPTGYPWNGGPKNSTGAMYQQIGDAVPPLLSAAVLGHLLGIPGWRDVCRYAYRPEMAA